MSENVEALVASPHWRWMPGMRYWSEHRFGWERIPERHKQASFMEWVLPPSRPDLDDPATLGCLLALVREAWGGEPVSVLFINCGSTHDAAYECILSIEIEDSCRRRFYGQGKDLCSAHCEMLVAALLAAPTPAT